MRLYLTGFMGSGKTVVGRILAKRLSWPFVDLDEEIQSQEGMSVRQIFELRGEAAFRDLEHERLAATARFEEVVTATGGGVPLSGRNREWIRRLGRSVWLHADFRTIASRLSDGEKRARPLFRSEERARALYQERLPAYQEADFVVEIGRQDSPLDVATKISVATGISFSRE